MHVEIHMNIIYPTTIEEWFVKVNTNIDGDEVYFEIPAIFVDGNIDQQATEQRVSVELELLTKRHIDRKNKLQNSTINSAKP
jgi:hypothetical protein